VDLKRKPWLLKLLAFVCALALATAAVGQCVIPGATTVVLASGCSPLAADTGKIYYITATQTCTLPSTPPTAVWRIDFTVKTGVLTISPNGLNIDQQASSENFQQGTSVSVSTDGTNYFTEHESAPIRKCEFVIGDTSASALTNAQLGPQSRLCFVEAPATILEMDVAADAGTPNIIVGRNHAGTIVNIVSSALATASAGGIACSRASAVTCLDSITTASATLQNTSLSAGDYLEAVSGTAGGAAKLMTVRVLYTLNHR
jgi:hypothetical protein